MADAVSHDQNFKNLIVEYPRQALEFFAPHEAPGSDDEASFVPVRQELLKERLGGRFRALDTPLLVEWADGRREAVVFAVEEESDWRRFSPLRLAHYCLDLADMLGTHRVVPVVVFLRDAAHAPTSLALGTERRAYLTFEYVSCKLAEMPSERWMESRNLVARVNLPNMRGYQARRIGTYAAAVRGLFELEPDPRRQEKYVDFIDTYADLDDNERRRYEEQYPQEATTMAGRFQRAREESKQQGIEQGERTLLRRQLRRRFGLLPPEADERIARASARDLESWAENVLDAGTLDEVFDSNH
ncbi:MAG: DUF4351 domain-containing protein [Gammaproteobacteria bacterium]|nr:DUF4351 domain-containing protein [Gammaproteobacteria bacterium]